MQLIQVLESMPSGNWSQIPVAKSRVSNTAAVDFSRNVSLPAKTQLHGSIFKQELIELQEDPQLDGEIQVQ